MISWIKKVFSRLFCGKGSRVLMYLYKCTSHHACSGMQFSHAPSQHWEEKIYLFIKIINMSLKSISQLRFSYAPSQHWEEKDLFIF